MQKACSNYWLKSWKWVDIFPDKHVTFFSLFMKVVFNWKCFSAISQFLNYTVCTCRSHLRHTAFQALKVTFQVATPAGGVCGPWLPCCKLLYSSWFSYWHMQTMRHTQRTNCCTRTAKVLECGGKDFSSVDVLDKNYQLFISKLWTKLNFRRSNCVTPRLKVFTAIGGIFLASYDYLTIMPKLRSTYDRLLIHKTAYEGRKAFLSYNSLAKS